MINNDKNYKYNRLEIKQDFQQLDRMAHFLDEQFQLANFKFGWDPILNLIPYVGKVIGFVTSVALVLIMAKHKVSGKVLIKMLGNVLLDLVIGSIPILGNVGDFFFKANTRNTTLLKEHYYDGKHLGSGKTILFVILLVFLVVMLGLIYLLFQLFMWSYHAIQYIF